MSKNAEKSIRIIGRVFDCHTCQGVPGLGVEVWGKGLLCDELIGQGTTNKNGVFTVKIKAVQARERFMDRQPTLFVKIFRDGELLKSTEDAMLWDAKPGVNQIVIEVECQKHEQPEPTDPEQPCPDNGEEPACPDIDPSLDRRQVAGQVLNRATRQPLPRLQMRAVDKDLRREEPLGEDTTDEQGRYKIVYGRQFSRAEKQSADLVVRAYAPDDVLLHETDILFNAGCEEVIDLLVESPQEPRLSEYGRLQTVLAPVLQDVPPAELDAEDVNFLVKELGDPLVDVRRLSLFAQDAGLVQETGLPNAFFYGVARALELEVPLQLAGVLEQPLERIRSGVERAVEMEIIPAWTSEQLDATMAQLQALRLQKGLLTARTFTGRLVAEGSGEPLSGHTVQVVATNAGPGAGSPVDSKTDAQGLFVFSDVVPRQDGARPMVGREYQFQILDRQGHSLHRAQVSVQFDQQDIIEIPVPGYALTQSPTLEDLQTTLQMQFPQQLVGHLAGAGIRTLADVRAVGGLAHLENLPIPLEDPSVEALQAHANLSVLSSDLAQNQYLIEQGFRNVRAIASTPRAEFVRGMHERLGDLQAAKLHVKAGAQLQVLNNTLMGLRADFANGFPSKMQGITNPALPDWFQVRCTCEDCESAVSPLAYLADLLRYTLTHLRSDTRLVGLEFLVETFHQPFADLPAACEQMDTQIPQVRLCTEVLRSYLGYPGSSSTPVPGDAERTYLEAAYAQLLRELGTSYAELRQALFAETEEEERVRLAQRLGLRPENLGDLFLDLDTDLSERRLEELFGLRDTTRTPLEVVSAEPEVLQWQLAALRTGWDAADAEQTQPVIDPDLVSPADFRNPVAGDPAFDLWRDRIDSLEGMLGDIRDARATAGLSRTEQLSAAIRIAIDTDLAALRGLAEGETVDGMTLPAVTRLLSLATVYERDGDLLGAEWQEFDDILVQAWKVRQYPGWIEQERGTAPGPRITLGPDHFRVATAEPKLQPWRSSREARNAWEETLEARTEQMDSVVQALESAVAATEAATLTILRDGLVQASPTGSSLEGRAKRLTERLLIDCQTAACQQTSRIAQAIETLQLLLFLARTGQLREEDFRDLPELTLADEYFDEKWKWLGSYATWRAAVFVFLYPENVLLPHLKRWQTPGFERLVRELRNRRRITPSQACDAATRYADYFRDVCNLEPKASVLVRMTDNAAACGAQPAVENRDLVYLFARGKHTRAIYVSWYGVLDESPYAQSFWDPVPGLESDVLDILGATVYGPALHQQAIYLFARVQDGGDQKLQYLTYDLQQGTEGTWSDLNDLDLPDDATSFSAVVKQRSHTDEPPHLAIRVPSGAIYARRMNRDGDDWDDGDWEPIAPHARTRAFGRLCAMVEVAHGEYFLFVQSSHPQRTFYRLFGARDDGKWRLMRFARGWQTAFAFPTSDDVYVWFKLTDDASATALYQILRRSTAELGTSEVATFDAFDRWLIDTTGWTLANPTVESRDYPRMSLLELFNLPDDSDEYREMAEHIIDQLAAQLERGDEPSWQDWSRVDVTVKQFSGLNLRDALRALLRRKLGDYSRSVRVKQRNTVGEQSGLFLNLPNLTGIVHAAGQAPEALSSNPTAFLAYERLLGRAGVFRARFERDEGGLLRESDANRLAPSIFGPFTIPQKLSADEADRRREAIRFALLSHRDDPASVLAYLKEAWYFVPVHLALQLQRGRNFVAALDWFRTVYDYDHHPESERNVYYGLNLDPDPDDRLEREEDWLLDPLNPHAIAASRPATYLRFTVMSIVRCLLEFADAEFTRDTAESLPRARALYLTALDLLRLRELDQRRVVCEIPSIAKALSPPWREHFEELGRQLAGIHDYVTVTGIIDTIEADLSAGGSAEEAYAAAAEEIQAAHADQPEPDAFGTVLNIHTEKTEKAHTALLSQERVVAQLRRASDLAERAFSTALDRVLFYRGDGGAPTSIPWLRESSGMPTGDAHTVTAALTSAGNGFDLLSMGEDFLTQFAVRNPNLLLRLGFGYGVEYPHIPETLYGFCVPQNAMLSTLRRYAELNLFKLRTCRNIAGLERTVDTYAAPTDAITGLPVIGAGGQITISGTSTFQPTPFRYTFIIERAKQLAQLASQTESAMFSAIERRDAELYNRLKAIQDLKLSRKNVRLQCLRVKEAQGGVQLARLQRDQAQFRQDHYGQLIAGDLNTYEILSLAFLSGAAATYTVAAVAALTESMGMNQSQFLGLTGQALSTTASVFGQLASYERRRQEWEFQRGISERDVAIGNEQIAIADTRVDIAEQEQQIGELQAEHAEDTLEFLAEKFTNVELYDWMSNVLEGVYSSLLAHAAATAKLAEQQLAFERQRVPAGIIQEDYWDVPSDDPLASLAEDSDAENRRGLTGSARLLQDISELDQLAFETDQRKLQLTRTISLAQLAPAEFQRFRETGVLPFETAIALFDRDFPGHYLRLIKRVRTSVIALIPPTEGIKATLSNVGYSSVVVNRDSSFQTLRVRRDLESVALTAPRDASGLFDLQPQPEKLFPFEGMGAAAQWEFRLPKAANLFDYNSIADVLFTVDYTALDSFDYRRQVLREMDDRFSADRPFSFRQEFADQWYDLNNPELTDTPMVVTFGTRREDFAPNLDRLRIQHVTLYFARSDGEAAEVPITHLNFTEQGSTDTAGGEATSLDGIVSTRRANGSLWRTMMGKMPIGDWELALPDTPELRARFTDEEIEDILLVITYSGRTPPWPA